MFSYKSIKELFLEEKAKNAKMSIAINKAKSDLDYIAMMTDVDLDEGGEDDEDEQEV